MAGVSIEAAQDRTAPDAGEDATSQRAAGALHLAAAWSAILPAAFVTLLALEFAAPILAVEPLSDPATVSVKEHINSWKPERLEQVRYVLAITIAPIVFLLSFAYLRRHSAKRLLWPAFAGQAALVGALVYAWRAEPFVYFPHRLLLLAAAVTLLVFLVAARFGRAAGYWVQRLVARGGRVLPISIAILLTAAFLWPSVGWDSEIYLGPVSVWYHLQHTAGEFFAIAAGRTPFVDFYPQYNSILPLVLAPLFKAAGANVLTFTAAMTALSFSGLLAIYFALTKLTGKASSGLGLYLPVLGLGFHHSTFTYYAVWPIRYVWPAVLAAAFAWTFRAPTGLRWLILGVFAGAGATNNFDFGLPALAACLAALVLSRPARAVSAVALFLGGVVASFLLIQLALFLRSGDWPDLSETAAFSRLFAAYGFWMIPVPKAGLYWTIYLTYMACLCAAAAAWWASRRSSLSSGLLAYAAVFGCGSFMYYIGRSHVHALSSAYVAWAFAVALLLHAFARGFRRASSSPLRRLMVVPGLLLVFHYVLFVSLLGVDVGPLSAQPGRWRINDMEGVARRAYAAKFVQQHAQPGEPVVLAFPLGSQVALTTGVRDVFPFSHPDTIVLKAQVQQLADAIRSNRVEKVFMAIGYEHWEDIRRLLSEHGLRWTASTRDMNLWSRDANGLSRPSIVGTPIDFRAGRNALSYQVSGWSQAETGMTWTNGPAATLTLPTTRDTGPLMLRIYMGGNVRPPELPFQPVGVYANGRHMADLKVSGLADFLVSIPADIASSGAIELELRVPEAFVPPAVGSTPDTRLLGVYLVRIDLVPSVVGGTIYFSDGGNLGHYRLSGWSGPEKNMSFTWSEGTSARLALPTSRDAGPLVARVQMGGLVAPPRLPFQPVAVYGNGRKLADLQVSNAAEFEFPIPEDVAASGIIEMEFRMPRAVSPKSLGLGADARALGIYVTRVQLLRVR